jgi:hypothetical protein
MKKVLLILFAGLMLGLTSCNDDNDPITYIQDVGTVSSINNGFYILSDNDNMIYGAANSATASFTVGQRVYFIGTLVREGATDESFDKMVEWVDVDAVRTKDIQILNSVSRDTIGDDWLIINSTWIKNQYYNVYFSFAGYNQMHYINLVYDSTMQTKQDTVILELKHDANNDYQQYLSSDIFSFDLSSIDWEGTPPHNIIVRYKNSSSANVDIKDKYTPPSITQ